MVFIPKSKSARKESKNTSHLSHFTARHVLDKMPQRTTRVPDVAAMPELASHLLCCVSRAPGPMGRCPSTRPSLSPPPCRSPSPPTALTAPSTMVGMPSSPSSCFRHFALPRHSLYVPHRSPRCAAHLAHAQPRWKTVGAADHRPPPPSPTCARGQAATGPLPAIQGDQWVRGDLLVLPHHCIAADEASAGRNRELRRAPLFSSRPMMSGLNSTKVTGFSALS